MKAALIESYGGPEVLQVQDINTPEPEHHEVLVRVIAAGTNPVDAKIRAAGAWTGTKLPAVLGYDASGVVEKVGAAVEDFKPGDEVFFTPEIFGNRHGTYAELAPVPAALVARKPLTLSHVEAAAIPLAGGTAWEAIVRRLAVRVGETVLIHGGAGGVGSFAVQFAKASGAYVLATAGTSNQQVLADLGADLPIDYTKVDVGEVVKEAVGSVDAVFDTVGGQLEASQPITRDFGRLASILAPTGDFTHAYLHNQTIHGVFLTRERRRLEELTPLFERDQARVLIEQVLPLERVADAHSRLDSGHGAGKVVLQIAES